MKNVYIAHPISGDIPGNIQKVIAICKEIHSETICPIAPYILSLQYMDDTNPDERRLGMLYNEQHFIRKNIIDELWVYGMSSGVQREINLAMYMGIPVIFKVDIPLNFKA